MKLRLTPKLVSNYRIDKNIFMKTRILLSAGLLAIISIATSNSIGVMAKSLVGVNLFVPGNAISIAQNTEAAAYKRSGKDKFDRRDYQGAIADYTRAISLDPNYATAYHNRGNSYRKLRDYSAAIADFNRAISLDPNYATAYYNRGNSYREIRNYSAAIADFNRAIRINPNYSDAYNNRGDIREKLGDYSGATADFKRALKIDPNNSAALQNINAPSRSQEQNTLDHMNRVRNAQTCCR